MKIKMFFNAMLLSVLLMLSGLSCRKESSGLPGDEVLTVPVVVLSDLNSLSGDVTLIQSIVSNFDPQVSLTDYGVCISKDHLPTVDDYVFHGIAGGTTSILPVTFFYSCLLSDLAENTNYNLRAFAINQAGTGYSSLHIFKTPAIIGDSQNNDLFVKRILTINGTVTFSYFYDSYNRLIAVKKRDNGEQPERIYTYDENGLLLKSAGEDGAEFKIFEYDSIGRRALIKSYMFVDSTKTSVLVGVSSYSYPADRITKMKYIRTDKDSLESPPIYTANEYDNVGNLLRETSWYYSSGFRLVRYDKSYQYDNKRNPFFSYPDYSEYFERRANRNNVVIEADLSDYCYNPHTGAPCPPLRYGYFFNESGYPYLQYVEYEEFINYYNAELYDYY